MVVHSESTMLTPERAKALLNTVKHNRKISMATVKSYADDMVNGRWYDNGIPIIVGTDGEMKDGSHRCHAVIEAKVSIPIEIKTVIAENAKGYDMNRVRSTVDIAMIEHPDDTILRNNTVNGAVTFLLRKSTGAGKQSKLLIIEMIEKMHDSLEFIASIISTNTKGIKKASVFAAMICAYYSGYDTGLLTKFGNVISTGIMISSDDSTIIRLREFLMSKTRGGKVQQNDEFLVTLNVLYNYEKGNVLTKLYVPKEPKYKLPCFFEKGGEAECSE